MLNGFATIVTVKEIDMRTTTPVLLPVKRVLAKLGGDIKVARLRRRITMTLMAERAFVARSTLQKVE